ncbi:caspase-2, partial [Notothenia coriiceps]|uniref:Caspase-2 n=1 Tax=Notothenia coriiceps TaxID=8208 RepID=A0A6I9P046_9TELE
MLECGMQEQDRRALRRNAAVLCRQLVVDELLIQILQADSILTESMAEGIMAKQISHKRSFDLLLLLPKRGPRAFSVFCSALQETEQQHLYDLIRQPTEIYSKETSLKTSSVDTGEENEVRRSSSSPVRAADSCLPSESPGREEDRSSQRTRKRGREEQTHHPFFFVQDMRTCIESFTRRSDHHSGDSSVVCLLSHGVEGAIYGTDGQLLQLDWVFESFDNAHCPLLQNKPKMFFIQACRGEEMDCGVEQIDGPMRTCSPSCEQRDAGREVDASSRQGGGLGRIKLPQRSDMICGYASLKGQSI